MLKLAYDHLSGAEVATEFDNSNVLCINKLEELLVTICHLNRKVGGHDSYLANLCFNYLQL